MEVHPDIQNLEEKDFDEMVLKATQPCLVAFGSPWSPVCQKEKSVLEEFAAVCGARLRILRVDVEDNPDLAALYEIRSIPTLLCFVSGQVKVRILGTCSKETILTQLAPVLQARD